MPRSTLTILILAGLYLSSCQGGPDQQPVTADAINHQRSTQVRPDTLVYQSKDLEVRKISDHVFEHVSFLSTESFGEVPCNGMVVVAENEAIVFDTPATGKSSEELVSFFSKKMACDIKAVVATHFHADCLAGLSEFHNSKIPSYSNNLTIALLKKQKGETITPMNGFDDTLELNVGNKRVRAEFIGEGHTKDNIIGYFPGEKIMFGGCLIKEHGAGKGNLEDANINAWSETVKKLKLKYPQTEIVIPGHGKRGGQELLDYTITLFE